MAELAVREGWPPPADLPRGECIMTSLPGGGIRIDQADPRILISAELLDAMVTDSLPQGTLDTSACIRAGTFSAKPIPLQASYIGAVLKIVGVNQQVVYRITEYVPGVHGYIGQWPD